MKNTALTHIHEALGAKLVPFAGYNMPVQYEGINIEHETVRTGVGVFDVSHMGEFFLKGENALALIQKVATNDASKLVPGKAQYSCMPNADGGIVDDLIIYMIAENEYMLVVNASNIEKDWNWIASHNDLNVTMEDRSDDWSLLAIQGPKAVEAMQSLTAVNLSTIKFYTFEIADFAGIPNVVISATGYTGSGGFEIYVKNKDVEQLWKKVFEAGADWNIKPIGLAARDTLRLEMGYCLYGNDIDDTTSPLEAGLGWITKFTKDFVNSEALKAQKEAGVTKKLVAFELTERGIPRHDYEIVDADGTVIGRVTSGTMSPSLGKGIGLGYVTKENSKVDSDIFIQVRKKQLAAKVVKLPFYKG
ncbi:glycine cleavage system aminomethyltransferase GcvT [Tenacibaculum finnmarkense genomovar finnmarkense]|uniref:glycine cleavage system aminomethyltransferase GcvT n=1 Tax=Tenacibaculum finnmarkense TaxID=2781243 RepID=UPI001E3F4A99|nr:glycine cleavage system aminomethyltransferase GcvT [Tenacibaculum finnmarkense]MCD8402675.1 glycine cleavage system aminomethyltransferase GcvT [Tenacibaculum finnmarkense genomovar finnmarkense]MCD8417927.1 glycine cleavage system aminomethyltransferase GcvT [Tenacibaculum finnmarkense genomovar finnmarkense]MCD8446849.1 glycine cleavage system aminomethyltransferase GcvT [Tenacibaculum finnmarkense genomovar finnmarkense]MCG8186314.1 glycine cleavage system aminomethyltransferase GcvT [Te